MRNNKVLKCSIIVFAFAFLATCVSINIAYANILYVGSNDTNYNFIKDEGYDIDLTNNVDDNINNYSLVMVVSYEAINHPEWKTSLQECIESM